jgi:hypothetical protein
MFRAARLGDGGDSGFALRRYLSRSAAGGTLAVLGTGFARLSQFADLRQATGFVDALFQS